MTSVSDIYDSEVLAIGQVLAKLNERARGRRHNYTAFEREIHDRFAEIGFTVAVNWYEFSLDGVKQDGAMPEITITARTEKAAWDPDRQVHEVVHDILGLGDGGWISTGPEVQRLLDRDPEGT